MTPLYLKPPHLHLIINTISPPRPSTPPHIHRNDSAPTISPPSHSSRTPHRRHHLIKTASPTLPHRHHLTNTISATPPHQHLLINTASPTTPHQQHLTNTALPTPLRRHRLPAQTTQHYGPREGGRCVGCVWCVAPVPKRGFYRQMFQRGKGKRRELGNDEGSKENETEGRKQRCALR